jgi:hypothetical protein
LKSSKKKKEMDPIFYVAYGIFACVVAVFSYILIKSISCCRRIYAPNLNGEYTPVN